MEEQLSPNDMPAEELETAIVEDFGEPRDNAAAIEDRPQNPPGLADRIAKLPKWQFNLLKLGVYLAAMGVLALIIYILHRIFMA
ncbi:MAG TPA: hypothetical protein P5161_02230 [Eubacteriales bacterium]|jgi:hypothetical protein|nr:hypothetical protein [Eubacteriales bacterium]HRU84185.1 hypothetical protein [Eubacteriales bacterium]